MTAQADRLRELALARPDVLRLVYVRAVADLLAEDGDIPALLSPLGRSRLTRAAVAAVDELVALHCGVGPGEPIRALPRPLGREAVPDGR